MFVLVHEYRTNNNLFTVIAVTLVGLLLMVTIGIMRQPLNPTLLTCWPQTVPFRET